jgi:hypothetical protein
MEDADYAFAFSEIVMPIAYEVRVDHLGRLIIAD